MEGNESNPKSPSHIRWISEKTHNPKTEKKEKKKNEKENAYQSP